MNNIPYSVYYACGSGCLRPVVKSGSYLFAERAIPRKTALQTEEAAAVVVFLLSPRSSGVVSQKIVVDAGMATNYFDKAIIDRVVKD